jgi:hypothetical protein
MKRRLQVAILAAALTVPSLARADADCIDDSVQCDPVSADCLYCGGTGRCFGDGGQVVRCWSYSD